MNIDKADRDAPSNAELKKLIEKALVRFQNWRTEVERDPNPRLVHQLKNLIAIVDSLTETANGRMQYSYKELARGMASLVSEVARLNQLIVSSLDRDDYLDAAEEREVTAGLLSLAHSAASLISMVQTHFGAGSPREPLPFAGASGTRLIESPNGNGDAE